MWLSKKEMEELLSDAGEITEGETRNVHHCKQGSGNDRLYIASKFDCFLFYCHHCHKKGKLPKTLAKYKQYVSSSPPPLPKTASLPSDMEYDLSLWPIEARVWIEKAKLKQAIIKDNEIGYSKWMQRVVIPVIFQGEYRGFVARRIYEEGPKYFARKQGTLLYQKHNEGNTIVIVEDILSCLKLYQAGKNSCALLGTHISDELIYFLVKEYSNFIIWLDDDKPEVKMSQISLKNRLSVFGNVQIVKTPFDPKEYTEEEIEEVLGCLK